VTEREPITHFEHPTHCNQCGQETTIYTRYMWCDHVLCPACAAQHDAGCNWRKDT